MAYVPQFIPTNTQALQGTLDQYQKASDSSTNLQNQAEDVYSSIPTTRAYDTGKKNEVMGQFAETLNDLDKKYNYDRSNTQYAKDLARKITGLRSNPLWAHIQQKDEIDKRRQSLIDQRGSNYIENVNPNDATLENQSPITNWKPQDLRDVKAAAAAWSKEFAQSHIKTDVDRSQPGWIKYTDYYGPQDMGEAINFLSGHKQLNGINGVNALDETIKAAGFDPSNPIVRNAAHDAFLTEAVGKKVDRFEEDHAYNARLAADLKKKPDGPGMEEISTGQIPATQPYAVKDIKDITQVKSQIDATKDAINKEADPVKKNLLIDQLQQQNFEHDRVQGVFNDIKNQPQGQKIIKTGEDIIKKYLPSIDSTKVSALNSTLTDLHQNNSDTNINPLEHYDKLALKTLGNIFKTVLNNGTGPLLRAALNIVNPSTRQLGIGELGKMFGNIPVSAVSGVTDEISKTIESAKPMYALAATVYDDEKKKGSTDIHALRIARNFMTDYADYNRGKGNYVGSGYNQIINATNSKLKSGTIPLFKEYALPSEMEKGDQKGEIINLLTDNMSALTPVNPDLTTAGAWKKGKAEEIASAFKDPKTSFHALFDNEGTALIRLSNPGTRKAGDKISTNVENPVNETFKIDPSKASFDLLSDLARRTGEPRFMSQIYSNFNLAPNKEYSVDDKNDNYLALQLTRYFKDISAFQGMKLRYDQDPSSGSTQYIVTTPEGKVIKEPNKIELLQDLDAYKAKLDAYNQSKK